MQGFTLYLQPILEIRAIRQGKPCHEFTAIKANDLLVALLRGSVILRRNRRPSGELYCVDIDIRNETNAVLAGGEQGFAAWLFQYPAQIRQGAAEIATRRYRVVPAPQQFGQCFPAVVPLPFHRKVAEQRAHLAVRNARNEAAIQVSVEAAQQYELEAPIRGA